MKSTLGVLLHIVVPYCILIGAGSIFLPTVADAAAKIEFEDADTIWKRDLASSGDLSVLARTVSARVVIEYTSSSFTRDLLKVEKITELAKSVPPRVIVEYTNSSFHRQLQKSGDIADIAKIVPPRIIAEYADSCFRRNLSGSASLGSLAGNTSPRIIVEYANSSFSRNLMKYSEDGITIPEEPETPSSDTKLNFKLSLDSGVNMVSLPLDPDSDFTARAFAEKLGATTVISFDTQTDEFIPFIPEVFSGDGFPIEGGQGYIVNMPEGRDVVFTGSGWSNMPSQAPTIGKPVWAFVVAGMVFDYDDAPLKDPFVHIRIESTGSRKMVAAPIGQSEQGTFATALVNMNREQVVSADGSLRVSLLDMAGDLILDPISYSIDAEDIRKGYAKLSVRLGDFIPEKNALLQNYPNPFNPETWMPYQLSEASDVVIRIFNSQGQLVRRLQVGQREAGLYLSRERAAYWNGRNEAGEGVSSGIYFYSIKVGGFAATKKLIVAR